MTVDNSDVFVSPVAPPGDQMICWWFDGTQLKHAFLSMEVLRVVTPEAVEALREEGVKVFADVIRPLSLPLDQEAA